jgi:hypothetical protein
LAPATRHTDFIVEFKAEIDDVLGTAVMLEFEDRDELEPDPATSLERRLDEELEPEIVVDFDETDEELDLEDVAILETRLDKELELELVESDTDEELELEVVLFGNDGAAETPIRINGNTTRNNIFT